MDHLPSAVVVLNSYLLVEEWNERATDLWGLEEPAVVGEPFFGLDFGLPLATLQEPVRACRSAGCGGVDGGGRGHRPFGSPLHLPRAGDARDGSRTRDGGDVGDGRGRRSGFVTPPSGCPGDPDLERNVDTLTRRLTALTDRILDATGSLPAPSGRRGGPGAVSGRRGIRGQRAGDPWAERGSGRSQAAARPGVCSLPGAVRPGTRRVPGHRHVGRDLGVESGGE